MPAMARDLSGEPWMSAILFSEPVVKSPQKDEKVENPMGSMMGAMRSFGQDASVIKKK
jgi:hypothetical protein